MMKKVHVVGSGLVGSLMAIFLAQKGYSVELYERRPDMRKADISAGRSINLVITSRGLEAVRQVGLEDKIMAITIPMKGRMLHDLQGQTTFVPYGQNENEVINSISRGELNNLLMDAVEEYPNVNLHFDKRCQHYDIESGLLTFEDGHEVQTEVVLGADGGFSAVRRSMLDQVQNFNYNQHFLEHGYKELTIPATDSGDFAIGRDYLHIWPRESHMLIALGNLDGSFTCTLFYAFEGEHSFASVKNEEDMLEFFQREFPDALSLMPNLVEDYFDNPVGSLVTVRCSPWHVGGRACLIGDAAHAIVPFFGQGMNCGFEDCRVLGELVPPVEEGVDWSDVFQRFQEARLDNAEAIADMAIENFVEMRDSTADPMFQLKKKVGFELEQRFPEKFIPRYSMVMFHPEIPYAEARTRSENQARLLTQLCESVTSVDQVNWEEAERMVEAL
jgi:kynurenine 3-monooxygenase